METTDLGDSSYIRGTVAGRRPRTALPGAVTLWRPDLHDDAEPLQIDALVVLRVPQTLHVEQLDGLCGHGKGSPVPRPPVQDHGLERPEHERGDGGEVGRRVHRQAGR